MSKLLKAKVEREEQIDLNDTGDGAERQHWADVARAFLHYEDFMLSHISNRQQRLNNLTEGICHSKYVSFISSIPYSLG